MNILRLLAQPRQMSLNQDRIFFGIGSLISATVLQIGAILSPNETRWVFATLATSVITGLCLSLIFKGKNDTIQLVVGRFIFSLISGVFLTKPVAYIAQVDSVHSDMISLGGVASICCIFGFIIGVAALRYLMNNSETIAKRLIDKKVDQYLPQNPPTTPPTA